MSTYTENYSLIKPDETDYYDVQDFNENMDIIDAQLAQAETAMEAFSEKIGTPEDTGSDTLFGKLSSGSSLIKSIQTVSLSKSYDGGTHKLSINTVDPSKCIVIAERWYDTSNLTLNHSYVLNADNLSVTLAKNTSFSITLHFQIIEFY